MRTSNRTGFWAALLLWALIGWVSAADPLPSSEDVDALSARAARRVETWESEGAKLWLVVEYHEKL